jgi:hypothetical protein
MTRSRPSDCALDVAAVKTWSSMNIRSCVAAVFSIATPLGAFCIGCATVSSAHAPLPTSRPATIAAWYSAVDATVTPQEQRARAVGYPDLLSAAPTREEAQRLLLRTDCFAGPLVGYGGEVSRQVRAFGRLLAEPDAPAAFRDLVQRGQIAGQLYGLCGLYLLDREQFRQVVEPYRNNSQDVLCFFGCLMYRNSIQSIVVDIIGGRYPKAFEIAAKAAATQPAR